MLIAYIVKQKTTNWCLVFLRVSRRLLRPRKNCLLALEFSECPACRQAGTKAFAANKNLEKK